MTEKTILLLVKIFGSLGVLMILGGVSVFAFTDLARGGNIMILALVIAIGMLFAVPAKIYLTFYLMKRNHQKMVEAQKRTEMENEQS